VRDAGDAIDLHLLRAHRLIGELDGVLGDIHGVIADPLEIGGDFEHGGDLSQLSGDRLLAPNELDAMRLDAPAKIVHRVIARDDARAGGSVAILQRVYGDADGVAHQRAEAHDVEPRRFQCFVIRRANGHRHLLQKCAPSISRRALPRNGTKEPASFIKP
jgi:hypothetical protein